MFTLESNEIIAFWANENLTFTFYVIISNSILNITTFAKEVFDSMFGLKSDEMTALWPNNSLTFTFFVLFSNSIPNWVCFVKEVFWFDV